MKIRTPWQVTKDVWYALLLRELLSRLTGTRYAWFWLLAEPVLMILFMMSLKLLVRGTGDSIAGADRVVWMILGLVGFFMIRDGAFRAMEAVQANRGIMAFKQVKPLDPVVIRTAVEGLLQFAVLIVLLLIFGLIGYPVFPANGLAAMLIFANLWFFALGLGLCFAVLGELLGKGFKASIRMLTLPLLLVSGVILPLHIMPTAILEYLMYNPIAHGLEYFRYVFFDRYHMVSGVSLAYFNYWVVGTLFVGMTLYMRFRHRMVA